VTYHLVAVFAVTLAVGVLLVQSGLQKQLLSRRRRLCASCGRELEPWGTCAHCRRAE
jgi:predicted amidophosphoribosyltransferase